MILKDSIEKLMRKENLDAHTCREVMEEIVKPGANSLQVAAFLVLLHAKSETVEELAAIVNYLKEKMIPVPTSHKVLDLVGTGGDGAHTINISTGSAILAASCGVKIAKHGNRAVSSLSGSADVLEALGVNIELSPEKVSACIDKVGIGFCFAPLFHPVLKELRGLRKQLNLPTVFNLVGPLLNPAHANYILMGVYHAHLLPLMAGVLKQRPAMHALIVHGCGLDELSCVGPAEVIEVRDGNTKTAVIDPATLGLPHCRLRDLQGGDAKTNAALLRELFQGKQRGAIANTLLLNAAAAMQLYGLCATMQDALQLATDALYSGRALTLLTHWIECSHD